MLIYITNPNKKVAKRIAKMLLEKKLIACANLFPIKSLYWWKDKIEEAGEWVIIAKTLPKNFKKVVEEVEQAHPYSIPCILSFSIKSNKKFVKWLKEVLG